MKKSLVFLGASHIAALFLTACSEPYSVEAKHCDIQSNAVTTLTKMSSGDRVVSVVSKDTNFLSRSLNSDEVKYDLSQIEVVYFRSGSNEGVEAFLIDTASQPITIAFLDQECAFHLKEFLTIKDIPISDI